MLPYLKPRRVAGLIVAKTKPQGGIEDLHEAGSEDEAIIACAEDMIRAMHAKDAKSLASALKAAFEIVDALPHVEGEHIEKDSE
jgi:hypothetical protein